MQNHGRLFYTMCVQWYDRWWQSVADIDPHFSFTKARLRDQKCATLVVSIQEQTFILQDRLLIPFDTTVDSMQ